MRVPEKYAAPSGAMVVDLVRSNPMALVVSSPAEGAPVANHLPIIFDPASEVADTFVGRTVLGHMARGNEQWQQFAARPHVLLAFSGPHGYVSPTSYGYDPAVPTYNYCDVHLIGVVEVIDDRAECLAIVGGTVTAFESLEPAEWNMTPSLELFESIVDKIVAFRVTVQSETAIFKLSQDMPDDVRERVRRDAPLRPGGDALAVTMDRAHKERTDP